MAYIVGFIGLTYLGIKINEGVEYVGSKLFDIKEGMSDKIYEWRNRKVKEQKKIQYDAIKDRRIQMKEKYSSYN